MEEIIPRHVFISYSREDSDFADELTRKLRRDGVDVWIDRESLEPGTPDWQKGVRASIDAAFAVIFVASPSSGQSVYVQAELAIAKKNKCPIYPVWLRGDDWVDCVPLDMLNYQYIDCRKGEYYPGINQAIRTMLDLALQKIPRHFAVSRSREPNPYHPKGFVMISHAKSDRYIFMNFEKYQTVQEALNDLYLNYLSEDYLPYAYGTEWCLVSSPRRADYVVAVLPYTVLANKGKLMSLTDQAQVWSDLSPKEWFEANWKIGKGTHLHIADGLDTRSFCIFATNHRIIAKELLYGSPKATILLERVLQGAGATFEDVDRFFLSQFYAAVGKITISDLGEVDLDSFSYVFVLLVPSASLASRLLNNRVMVI